MPELEFRRYESRLEIDIVSMLERIFSVLDEAGLGEAAIRFYFEDAGAKASSICTSIAARFPEFQPFYSRTGMRAARLVNLGSEWDVANSAAAGMSVPRATLLEVLRSLSGFTIGTLVVIIGPVAWTLGEAVVEAGRRPFSARFPTTGYFAGGVILQRLSSGRVNIAVTEQVTASQESPEVVQKLAAAIGAGEGRIHRAEVSTSANPPPRTSSAEVHERYVESFTETMAALALPHELPDPAAAAKLPRAPIGKIRSELAHAFKADGWTTAKGTAAGTHSLWKITPRGTRMELYFDTGSWLRFVLCQMKVVTGGGLFRLPVNADKHARGQYMAPNPEVFAQIVDNLRIVVRHFEQTWVAELEACAYQSSRIPS